MQLSVWRTGLVAGVVGLCTLVLASTAQAQIRIVAIGDSNIAGRGVSSDQAYPAKLERALRAKGYDVVVTNAGVNGDTTAGVLARLDSSVPDGTHVVIVSAGANDVFLHGLPRSTVVANTNAIASRLRARGMEVLVIQKFQEGLVNRNDLHVEQSWKPGTTMWHLNPAGYDIVVARTLPRVQALVAKAKTKAKRR